MENLQPYDFIILALLGWFTLRGVLRGMTSQIASLVSLAVTWWASVKFCPVIAPAIKTEAPWNKIVAILIIFVAVYLGVKFLHRILDGIIAKIRMRNFDRLLGGLFGLMKGIFLGMVLTFFAVTLSTTTCEKVLQSKSGVYLSLLLEKTASMLPADVNELVTKNLEAFRTTLDKHKETAGSDALINNLLSEENQWGERAQSIAELNKIFRNTPDPANEKPALEKNPLTEQGLSDQNPVSHQSYLSKSSHKPIPASAGEKVHSDAAAVMQKNPPVTRPDNRHSADSFMPVPSVQTTSPVHSPPRETPSSPNSPSDRKRWLELMLME
ncbi:MAG: CvpA family protein [Planctomycetaceae bacterium]|jgi:membrane protein required for colicin V production|nr:CvpA family protein [Planctomycetaceae bacterium]